MKTILVTGGAGFIGSNFIRMMLKKYPDYKIINYDALTYAGRLENLKDVEGSPNYKFIKGDICNIKTVDKAMKEVDWVVHFAAESGFCALVCRWTEDAVFYNNKVRQ